MDPAAKQRREVQFKRLEEEFRVVPVPKGHGRVQRIEDVLNFRSGGRQKAASLALIKFKNLDRIPPALPRVAARIEPEVLPLRNCGGRLLLQFLGPGSSGIQHAPAPFLGSHRSSPK